jgi:hypothetical protein
MCDLLPGQQLAYIRGEGMVRCAVDQRINAGRPLADAFPMTDTLHTYPSLTIKAPGPLPTLLLRTVLRTCCIVRTTASSDAIRVGTKRPTPSSGLVPYCYLAAVSLLLALLVVAVMRS